MKITYSNEAYKVNIATLQVGRTFIDTRRSIENATAVYMVVDKNSGALPRMQLSNELLAINLETAQLKRYPIGNDTPYYVQPVNAEVIVK